jgi:hypothetical protein
MSSRVLFLTGLLGIAALGCARATFHDIDGTAGTGGGASAGSGGRAGTGGDGQGGTGGGAGDVIGGNGGGGAGGIGGSTGLSGRGGGGGTGGSGVGGGTAGRGGTGGTGGNAGTGGTGGRGGSGGIAGSGGAAGTGAGGRGGGGGTAGTGGVPGVMPTVAGQIVITELLHDVPGNDDNSEWFEIYNPSTTVTYNLMSCDVGDVNTYVPITLPLVIPPGAFRTLGIVEDVGFKVDYAYGPSIKFDSQGADSARIRCGAVLIDEFAYSVTDSTDPNAVGKTFSVDPRHYSAVDNDVRANWCLATATYMAGTAMYYGTPGAANPQCAAVTQ